MREMSSGLLFAGALVLCACLSACMASLAPLQFSLVSVFLFAGPHNWFELRYFLARLPVRFGRARQFFRVAFTGLAGLTLAYIFLPLAYDKGLWSGWNWFSVLAAWNAALILWIAVLVWLRGKEKRRFHPVWILASAFALGSINWSFPGMLNVAIVYLHPLMAFWVLDRHLRRTRRAWLPAYRTSLVVLPLLIALMIWHLGGAPSIENDNGLAWRISQQAGGALLPQFSNRLVVAGHVFLEVLHYAVWLVALPLIGARGPIWEMKSIPLFHHPRGFPQWISAALAGGVVLVLALWIGFVVDYSATRDVYFTFAIAHVLAEAPFLLRTI